MATKNNQIRQNNKNSFSTKEVINSRKQSRFEQMLSFLPINLGYQKPVIAILRLEGIIGRVNSYKSGLSISNLNKLIEQAFKTNRLEAVCLVINSPGGSPVQSELIAGRIIQLAEEMEIPVYSFVEDVAASGGYWLAAAGDKIFASKSSIIGSIGVIHSSFGFHEAIAKLGIERRIYAEGNNKSVLDPFEPAKPSDIKLIKNLEKNIHGHFISYVKSRRNGKLTQSDEILFNGEFWTGQTAVDYGLVDGIDNVYSFINKHYGDEVKIEYVENKQGWFKKKLGMSALSSEIAHDIGEGLVTSVENKLGENRFRIK